MPKLNMVQAINLALKEEMSRDSRVVVLGEDVGKDGGVFRITESLYDEFGPERLIDTPLSESGIIGTAIGMAVYGLRPVAEIQFMGFIYSAFDQIFSHAARIRYRSRGRYTCPIVIRTPYGAGVKALELHSESTEAFFCHMPGIKVVVPSTPYHAKGLLTSSIRDPDPVIFLKARIVQEGNDITIISWGSMLHRTLQAVEGYDAKVIDLMTLNPFDEETLLNSVKKTGRVVIVHEAPKTCGFGAELSATIAEEAILYLKAPILRVTGYDVIVPLPKLEDYYLPSVERIRKALEEVMKY